MSSLPLPPPPPQPDPSLDPGASSIPGGKKKRGGAPKAKGAVRAKSGCYTCRIRRKKCDEQPDRDGNCQTCVRLRLECLGFGAKRPDWMRENNSVQELREKIKQFLASQGMIKGHSGGGVRPADQDPASSSTMSPPTGDHSRLGPRMPPISSVRDGPPPHVSEMVHFPPLPGGHPFPPPPGQGVHVLFSVDPQASRQVSAGHPPMGPPHPPPLVGVQLDPELEHMPQSYGQPSPHHHHHHQQPQSRNMSFIPASPWPSAPSLLPPSSFGPSYNIHDDYFNDQQEVSSELVTTIPHEIAVSPFPYVDDMQDSTYLRHYMQHVLKIQYLLADRSSIERFIFQFAQTSASARSAMCLLSAVHLQRMRHIEYPGYREPEGDTAEMNRIFLRTRTLLQKTRQVTEGDAMAGLHVVSCFLFTGGQGPWHRYLYIAMYWVESIFKDTRYDGPWDAYRHCTESQQFIIRTTMWFDVWSAITRRTPPCFQEIYRQLFGEQHGYPGTPLGGVDMLSVMGCTNETVLAMSETASLAHWKDTHTREGDLSVPMLSERGRNIETQYLSREHDAILGSTHGNSLDVRRRLAANVFRASARVYLHSVLSGCRPNVKEIAFGVDETVNILKRVPSSEGASRSVVRSVVLSIALCGCMTDDAGHREFLSSCLVSLAGQEVEVLGNCTQAKKLMERVWEKRDGGDPAVDWRDVIHEMAADLLLV
ncbi:hypothetical protein K439DRAFT_1645074 [Ramaria rubella]|nr:hypothetical protein K439DRAFT_1645074 [Ramaria rubella]